MFYKSQAVPLPISGGQTLSFYVAEPSPLQGKKKKTGLDSHFRMRQCWGGKQGLEVLGDGPGSGLAVCLQASEAPLWASEPIGRKEGVISEDEGTECWGER